MDLLLAVAYLRNANDAFFVGAFILSLGWRSGYAAGGIYWLLAALGAEGLFAGQGESVIGQLWLLFIRICCKGAARFPLFKYRIINIIHQTAKNQTFTPDHHLLTCLLLPPALFLPPDLLLLLSYCRYIHT